jgi:type I protein arginine methyltransferase
MYSFYEFAWMMEDEVRNAAYIAALEKLVKPDSVVVDLGAGVGTWSFFCHRLGARKIYAIESLPAIHAGKQLAAANGLTGKIEFIHALSTDVKLAEKADVIVFEIHGQQPLFAGSLATIMDARDRFLKPGGALVPRRELLYATVVEDAEKYNTCVGFWDRPFHGFNMSSAKPYAADHLYKSRFRADQALTEYAHYFTLDYAQVASPDVISDFTLTAHRAGTGHGVHLWFDSDLAEGIGFSNAPGSPRTIFGGTFLPWRDPVSLDAGDQVALSLAFRWAKDTYIWSCHSRILRGGKIKAQFSQSLLTQNLANILPKSAT